MELDVDFAAKLATKDDVNKLRRRSAKPLHIRRVTSVTAVISFPTVISLGSPATGREWNLMQILVIGSDDRTVVPGTSVASYIGDPANASPAMLIDPGNGSTVPNVASFSSEVIWVTSESELFVIVYGAVSAQPLTAIAFLNDYAFDAVEPTVI